MIYVCRDTFVFSSGLSRLVFVYISQNTVMIMSDIYKSNLSVCFKRHNCPMILRGKDMNILFTISEYPDVTS